MIRAQLLTKFDALIRENREDLARMLIYETGKPFAEACGEIDYATSFTHWFAGEAERISGTVHITAAPNRRVFTIKQPIGVVVGLAPWNFPIATALRKVAAAMAAGCTIIIKPSPETPFTTLALAHLAQQAGFAAGVFNVLPANLANTPSVCEALCKHPLVSKVSLTGSTRVGKLITKHCAEGLKKVTLELGGNCPYIIFDDANLEQALSHLMALKFKHAGQVCVTANRVYVQAGVYEQFSKMVADATRKLKLGHGAEDDTTIGPVTTPQSLGKIENQIKDAVAHGGKLIVGGHRVTNRGGGYFFEPSVITNMTQDMLLTREETFGPVCGLYKFDTEEEVVGYANDTSLGLASYFFTKNVDRTWRLLENLEAGIIGMNTGEFGCNYQQKGSLRNENRANVLFHRQYGGSRQSVRRYQAVRIWQGVRQRRRRGRILGHEDRDSYFGGTVLDRVRVYRLLIQKLSPVFPSISCVSDLRTVLNKDHTCHVERIALQYRTV